MASETPTRTQGGGRNNRRNNRTRALNTLRNKGASNKPDQAKPQQQQSQQKVQQQNLTPRKNPILIPPPKKNVSNANQIAQIPGTSLTNDDNHTITTDSTQNFAGAGNVDRVSLDDYHTLDPAKFIVLIGGKPYCILCDETVVSRNRSFQETERQHVTSNLHCQNYKAYIRHTLLRNLPSPSESHLEMLNDFIDQIFLSKADKSEGKALRLNILKELNHLVEEIDTKQLGFILRPIGSSFTGAETIESDLNLELYYDKEPPPDDGRGSTVFSLHRKLVDPDAELGQQINQHVLKYDMVPNAVSHLFELGRLIGRNIQSKKNLNYGILSYQAEINSLVPRLLLEHSPSNIHVEICCYVGSSHALMRLLRWYLGLDIRAKKLSIFMKHWAKMFNVSNPAAGSFPPYAFVLLVIHYLQRTEPPILPCFHDIRQQTKNMGEKLNDLSLDIKSTSSTKEPNHDSSKVKLNANSTNKNSSEPNESTSTTSEDSDDGSDSESIGENFMIDEEEDPILDDEFKAFTWSTQNNSSMAQLLIGFLQYLTLGFNYTKQVISIRTLKSVLLTKKKWNTKVIAIEDPVRPSLNLSKSVATQSIFLNFIQNLQETYRYLLLPPVHLELNIRPGFLFDDSNFSVRIHAPGLHHYMADHHGRSVEVELVNRIIKLNAYLKVIIDHRFNTEMTRVNDLIADSQKQLFKFEDIINMKDVAKIPSFCWVCRSYRHTRDKCPNIVVKIASYPENDMIWLKAERSNLNGVFIQRWLANRITELLAKTNTTIVENISMLIRENTSLKDCKLELFGSTVNGLGTAESDLDVCMTLESNPSGKNLKFIKVLEEILTALENSPIIVGIVPILSAKVPIIKFKYSTSDAEKDVDLSMYNRCACYNTNLIRTYCHLDERVAPLCYIVRKMAKSCGVCDAPRGSLSSYAWTLLVIHYLQREEPPVLPCLQQLHTGTKPIFGVSGWNVWFCDDPEILANHLSQNKLTIVQLYMRFLAYYSRFNFDINTVSIRMLGDLPRHIKRWNGCNMAIEDPFELTWNLASRVDEKMACFIRKVFFRAYNRLCEELSRIDIHDSMQRLAEIEPYIFDGRTINFNEMPPNRERGCHRCGKDGHKINQCPQNRRKKGRKYK